MKRLVIQVMIDDEKSSGHDKPGMFSNVPDMFKVSERYAKGYAKKVGADYYKVTSSLDWNVSEDTQKLHPTYHKFKMYDLDYDQYLYIDADFIINPDAPNIFEEFVGEFCATMENTEKGWRYAERMGVPPGKNFNAGFYMIKRSLLDRMKPLVDKKLTEWKTHVSGDQDIMNQIMYELDIEVTDLGFDWNPIYGMLGKYGDHYTGPLKQQWELFKDTY